ncbi:MAG: hypothetical protein J4A00_07220 [Gammaproteobacteria bacterium]|nr:hypothetical protein [Gammaproteobacteria bacterium]
MRLLLFAADLLANLLFGALAGLAASAVIPDGWNMFVAMVVAMPVGMLVGLIGSLLLLPLLGAMEVMLPLMLTGMVAGMAVGMMAAMHPVALQQSLQIGALFGLVSFGFCFLANLLLQGQSKSWIN